MGKIKGAQFIIWDLVPLQNIWSRVLNFLPAGLNHDYICYFSFNSDLLPFFTVWNTWTDVASRQSIMFFGFRKYGGLDGLDLNLYNY